MKNESPSFFFRISPVGWPYTPLTHTARHDTTRHDTTRHDTRALGHDVHTAPHTHARATRGLRKGKGGGRKGKNATQAAAPLLGEFCSLLSPKKTFPLSRPRAPLTVPALISGLCVTCRPRRRHAPAPGGIARARTRTRTRALASHASRISSCLFSFTSP